MDYYLYGAGVVYDGRDSFRAELLLLHPSGMITYLGKDNLIRTITPSKTHTIVWGDGRPAVYTNVLKVLQEMQRKIDDHGQKD